MLKPKLRLSGVKATLNRVAEKAELAMHGLSDLDSSTRSAEASGKAAAASHSSVFDSERRMMGDRGVY